MAHRGGPFGRPSRDIPATDKPETTQPPEHPTGPANCGASQPTAGPASNRNSQPSEQPTTGTVMTTTALVLGSGGQTGAAWELGILAGLADEGIDLTDADTVVGTSAGSVVGAQIRAGVPVEQLYADQLAPPTNEIAARIGVRFYLMVTAAVFRSSDPVRFRQRIGARALRTKTIPADRRREVVATGLPYRSWPERRLVVVAVGGVAWRA